MFLGTLADYSAPLLSSKGVRFMFKRASGMSMMCLISNISSLRGSTSQVAVESDMYSALVVDREISD